MIVPTRRIIFWCLFAIAFLQPISNTLMPPLSLGPGLPDLDIARLACMLMVFFYISNAMNFGGIRSNSWLIVLAFFYLLVMASPIWSVAYDYSIEVVQQLFDEALLPIFFALAAFYLYKSEEYFGITIKVVVLSSVIFSLVAVYQYVSGTSMIKDELRSVGVFSNPNILGIYLVMCFPFLAFSRSVISFPAPLAVTSHILLALGVFASGSRKSIFALLISHGIFLLYSGKKWLVGLILLCLFVGPFFMNYVEKTTGRYSIERLSEDIEGKEELFNAGLRMFRDSPVFGSGYKGYNSRFNLYVHDTTKKNYDAHNEYITALVNYGLVGFSLFALMFILPLRDFSVALMRDRYGEQARIVALGAMTALLSFAVCQYFAGGIFSTVVFQILVINIAFGYGVLRHDRLHRSYS